MINRRFKKLFVALFFICFLYFFLKYGFEQKEDIESPFGHSLDRNFDRIRAKKHREPNPSSEITGEAAIWEAVKKQSTTTESQDDKILREFLEQKKTSEVAEPSVNKLQSLIQKRRRRNQNNIRNSLKNVTNSINKVDIDKIVEEIMAKFGTGKVTSDKPTEMKMYEKLDSAESKEGTRLEIVTSHTKTEEPDANSGEIDNTEAANNNAEEQETKNDVTEDPAAIKQPEQEELERLEQTVQENLQTDPIKSQEKPPFLPEAEPPLPPDLKTDLGEYGRPVTLPPDLPDNIKQLVDDGWKQHQFNEYISNLISVKRSLLDFRSDYCHDNHKSYMKDLPPVSIIIVFYNEAWSTLLRTIHSVIDRTPNKLIKEILLVDDYSDMPHLKAQLDDYVKESEFEKIRVLRNAKREGLIRARNRGAKYAKANILVFLDSHIECTNGWLEPLVDRIANNKTSIAVPVIEQINDETFELQPRDRSHFVSLGGFGWNLQFRWFYMKSTDRKHPEAPISSPTLAGGLFAISADFFKHVGMYDPGLELWGGENLELSFKTWMCGGHIQMVPCSHVGHVFRKKSPYEWSDNVDIFRRNSMRVANVWMDDYIKFYKAAAGPDDIDFGDISDRVKLRKNLKCNDFSWYLKNVYPERSIPSDQIAYGQIQNLGYNKTMCLDGKADKATPFLSVFKCHGKGGTQYWEYNGEIYRDNYCVTYDAHDLMTKHCRKLDKQTFMYEPSTQHLILKSNVKCLEMTKDFNLSIEKCDKKNEAQKWKLENFDSKKLEKL
ncbi:putative polypeptide N-acetylgalactosaminyltransferase 9 [Chironomus tepperi]|uniref:putative polypeptide N-acetylgalactosaminyltransferase 9 n=1 Tax=Chironomus tepperi TaxID=113505 RepID=UPI00391F3352